MKKILLAVLLSGVIPALPAAILLDDTFADGTRTNQNLPNDSAWFTTSAANMRAFTNVLSVTNLSTSSSWWTYFTTPGSPVSLGVGDTLQVTLAFTVSGVGAQNTSKNLRFGLYNSTGVRPTTDGSLPTVGYLGYIFFSNFGATWGTGNELRYRTAFSSNDPLSASGDSTVLATGASVSGTPAFSNNVPYTLDLIVTRSNATTVVFSATYGGGGLTNSVTATDSTAVFTNFDMIQIRPSGAATTATNFNFTRVTVSLNSPNSGTPPAISLSPPDVSAYTGQSAFFSVVSDGSAPLIYQWYFNTNTPIVGATNASLSLTNLQLTDSGTYTVIVTNLYGSDTSDVAQLTVTVPVAPVILTPPQSQTVLPGANATFNVSASGSTPLSYQWWFNTNFPIAGANSSALTVNNVQATNAGTYSVVVNNLAGSATSSVAVLTLNTSPVAPVFVSQPASVIALVGGAASFNASASGSAPIFYQWLKNGAVIAGATNPALTLLNVQNSDAATYALRASNSVGSVTSSNATLTVATATALPNSAFNLAGFGFQTTGGGVIAENNSAYRKVTNALDFAKAIADANKTAGSVRVIEIMNDLDLGWNEVGSAVQLLASTPFRAHNPPQLHPRLLTTGVSLVDIKAKGGNLTIFSANGATIRHACFNIKTTQNIIVRNLKFDEMWEWDELSKGNYDKNDWDFIDLGNGGTVTNIWIDHCTFTKTYDGIVDIKQGSSGITISWCKYVGDDGATNMNSFVRQQISALESNRASYAFYNFLRNNGFSTNDIITILQGHDKTHLIGANSLKAENTNHTITLHHSWFLNPWDRLPRLRGGNVHNYNLYVDDTLGLAAKRLRDTRANAMSTANRNTLNNTYNFNPFLNGSISTESGAVLVEKSVYIGCLTPLRNNQTDPANAIYTGKIRALDSIYQFDSTFFRGNSTDPGGTNTFGPVQAPVIPFSWNLPGGVLPYAYTMDDPAELANLLPLGAGAGVVNWNKTNWLLTTYAPSAPVITAQPQGLTLAPGGTASFTVAASGSAPLTYRWFINTNMFLVGATNSTLTLANVQSTNAGNYFVVITNIAGAVTSSVAALTVSSGTPSPPQVSNLVFGGGSFGFTINGVAGQPYLVQASTNLSTWITLFTTNPATLPFTWSDPAAGTFPQRYYRIQLGP